MTWSDFILRGTILLAAAFLTSYAFARASAALRHLIWTSAFLGLLLLPAVLRLAPKVALAAWPAAATATAPNTVRVESTTGIATTQRPTPAPRTLPILPLYLAGALLVAVRFIAGAMRTGRLVRAARPALHA